VRIIAESALDVEPKRIEDPSPMSQEGRVESKTKARFDEATRILATDNVSRYYSRGRKVVKAVDGVTITVARGRTVAVVGETGSGKSTLGRLLVGLESPTSGSVYFLGQDIGKIKRKERRSFRREVQLVFQDPLDSLDPRWSVQRIVAEPLLLYEQGPRRKVQERVDELLSMVGLDTSIRDRRPSELSGGQRQRVGIARAIAPGPRVIVADEPVSALDVSVQAQIANLLVDLQRRLGISYVIIAHGLEVVRYLADEVAVMYLGRVVEVGRNEQVFGQPRHPYTESLLASVPRPDPRARLKLKVANGEVDLATDVEKGCRFRPRCPRRQVICGEEEPVLVGDRLGGMVACHFPDARDQSNHWNASGSGESRSNKVETWGGNLGN